MGKRRKKNTSNSSGSGSGSESCRGDTRGAAGGPSVSDLLGQANSVLFDNSVDPGGNADSVFMPASSTPLQKRQTDGKHPTMNSGNQPSNADIFTYLKEMNRRLETMELKLQTLDLLKNKVEGFDQDLKKLWTLVHDQQKESRERLSAVEERVDSVEFSHDQTYEKVNEMESANQLLKDEVVYLQAQSMRNNLVFNNIQEEEGEDAEKKLKEFFVQKMSLAQDFVDSLVLERVHRMGTKRQGQTRGIVAKFHEFKDREFVRRQSKVLKGTHFFVNEQFPKEIADKRRKLVPKMKEARQQGKRSWISYDTLYVDGRPVRA